MTTPVLEAMELSVSRGERAVLKDVSLSIPAGSRTLIRGKSGAGKSTLFSVLGLLEEPDSGRVVVGGTDAASLPERKRARLRRDELGFVFQDFQLVPDLTARENARLPQTHAGSTDDEWIDELFDTLGIDSLASRYPPTLSGGEKQRVAIARALANRPTVILADEPTGQLDPETTRRVVSLLGAVQDRTNTALVAISHDPGLEPAFARTLELSAGRLERADAGDDAERAEPVPSTDRN